MIATMLLCSRCREQVARGAPWCPHCGYDMTVDPPVEVDEAIRPHWEWRGQLLLDALVTGLILAGVFGVVELILFATVPIAAIHVGWISLLLVLFYMTEAVGPADRYADVSRPTAPGASAYVQLVNRSRDGYALAPAAGILLTSVPVLCAMAVLVFAEHLVAV